MARSKLERSQLPNDRRYSRERLWAQPTQVAGVVRVGVAFRTVSEDARATYFASIPQVGGHVAAGRRLGFLDVDTGRFDLVSPVSGRVTATNQAIDRDPGILGLDSLHAGWLCEVALAPGTSIDQLFDRDAFFAYLEFERDARRLGLSPTVLATYRMDERDPWPRELEIQLGGRVMLRSRALRLGRNDSFTPLWQQGDKWKVRCTVTQPSIAMVPAEFAPPVKVVRTWQLEVIDEDGSHEGTDCYVVRAREVEGTPPLTFFHLHVAKEDFTLRLLEEISTTDTRRKTRIPNAWGAESYLELRLPRELIVDFPIFPSDDRDEVRTITGGYAPDIRQETRFPDARTMTIACETPLRTGVLRSEQTWQKGLPWWKSAQRRIGDFVQITGELVN